MGAKFRSQINFSTKNHFITAIIDIEREFDIEISDEFLRFESMEKFERLYEIVSLTLQQKIRSNEHN